MDQAHLAQLLVRHRTALYAYLFAAVRNHADAEDLLQIVSLAVVESAGQLANEAGFVPWSLEIARRRILEFRRHRAAVGLAEMNKLNIDEQDGQDEEECRNDPVHPAHRCS